MSTALTALAVARARLGVVRDTAAVLTLEQLRAASTPPAPGQ
ncbi:hypothetical protein [Rhodococcus sp. YH1]